MAAQKFGNFDNFLKECTLVRQLPQNNLKKLFCMKLKSIKRSQSRLTEKKRASWPTQCVCRCRFTCMCVCRYVHLSDLTLFQVASSCLSDICSG